MTKYRYSRQKVGDVWQLSVVPFPDWQDFDEFTAEFLAVEKAKLIEKNYGLDLHQIRFRLGQHQYVLHFEHYTESIWVEQDF
ncbi:DUF3630 family protein [Psychrosphaera sp. B3R10]|uniref:DUF3630 family protein n=1 Tax=Psychrosphaera algicola TaxID=3023714 RepID=A0ABT5FCB0_9GAMM|nr:MULTISPECIES: DUF3630 family protein [unclassified Psychrosphaera]MBU2880389.1 DUF3630 family protein [Psychrosphaera sp. I2R16]MBU2987828.1 DUF3630 family protein [Psychrosphaera sp. B3R10]MDC2889184.1 DUF3630 family protein [Psychrosphaera sp. G1-22]